MAHNPVYMDDCASPALGADKASYIDIFDDAMAAIDAHDHTNGKGKQVPREGIEDLAINTAKLALESVDATILAASVAGAGLSGGGGVALSVLVDDLGIEISSDAIRLKSLGVLTGNINDLAVTTAKLGATSVTAAKLGSDVAGNGLGGGNGTALSVNVDGVGLEISADAIQLKDGGISAVKLAANVAGNGLGSTLGVLSVNVDNSSLEITADNLNVKAAGITHPMMAARPTGSSVAVGGVAISATSTGLFSSSSASYVDVTNATVTIVASGNRPIMLALIPDGTSNAATVGTRLAGAGFAAAAFKFVEGASTDIAVFDLEDHMSVAAGIYVPPATLFTILSNPSAGSKTYKLQVRTSGTSDIYYCKLMAIEL